MADIAFLLLVFFLLATTISVDKGIEVILPEWREKTPLTTGEKIYHDFRIHLNSEGDVLINNSETDISGICTAILEFYDDPDNTPDRTYLNFNYSADASYEDYIKVYNEVLLAYRIMRDRYAVEIYGKEYDKVKEKQQQEKVKKAVPLLFRENSYS